MKIKEINVNRYIGKSKIPGIDFVINPYIGCPNACRYCYAAFLSNLTGHSEKWGSYLDIKKTNYILKKVSVENKTYLISSSTDCYNIYEEKYQITRKILEELVKFHFNLIISTKNSLILRDLDLLKKFNNLKVIISLFTLDNKLCFDLEKYSSITTRLDTLQKLYNNGIYTILNISPIFPFLTNYKEIIKKTKDYVREYHFEFLKLKNNYKRDILKYIQEKHDNYYLEYAKIYLLNDDTYFLNLKKEITIFCKQNNIKFNIYN